MKAKPIVEFVRQYFKGSPLRIAGRLLSVLLTLTGFVCIIYFIVGPARGYFHSDYTDTVYWAYTSVESGLPLNPDFGYAAILPFGSQLWLVPLLSVFGLNYSSYAAGMVIFAIIYFASLIFLAQRLGLKGGWRMMFITGMIFLLSGSEKLREMMWGHAIYYSLSILFFVLGSALVLSYLHRQPSWATMILLAILTAGVATDNVQMIALYFVPLLGAALFERFFEPKAGLRDPLTRRTFSLSVIMLSMTIIGMGILYLITDFGEIGAGYAQAYSTFSGPEEWLNNALGLLPNLMSLYGIIAEDGASIISADTISMIIKLAGLLIILITPIAMFKVYRRIDRVSLKFFMWTHALTSIIILFLVTIGSLGRANWRLIPMLGTAVPATILSLKWIFDESERIREKPAAAPENSFKPAKKNRLWFVSSVRKRFAIFCLSVLLLDTALTAYSIYSMPIDYGRDNTLHQLTEFLEEQGLEYGYATFWNSQAITILSDNEVRVRNIEIDGTGINERIYQSDKTWFEDQPGIERYFILLSEDEFVSVQTSTRWIYLEPILDAVLETDTGHFVIILTDNPWNQAEPSLEG